MKEPQEIYTVAEAAVYLKISIRTMWNYINSSTVQFFLMNPHGKRRQIRFTHKNLTDFIEQHSQGIQPEARPKRAYHRTKKKYARTKKKSDGKKGKIA